MNEEGIRQFAAKLGVDLSPITKPNNWIDGHCPFAQWRHERGTDTRSSFGIFINGRSYSHFKCFGCGSTGTLPNLAFTLARFRNDGRLVSLGREIERAELFGAKEEFADWDFSEQENEEYNRLDKETTYDMYPSAYGEPEATQYLQKRKISYRTAIKIGLRYDPEERRILFPIFDERNNLVGLSGRSISRTGERFTIKVRDYHGFRKREHFLGEHRIRSRRIICTEGLFDYANLIEYGISSVLSTLGSGLSRSKIQKLEKWNLPIIWMLDNDEPGYAALWGPKDEKGVRDYEKGLLYRLYDKVPQMLVEYPENVKDPGELTKEQAIEMIKNADFFVK